MQQALRQRDTRRDVILYNMRFEMKKSILSKNIVKFFGGMVMAAMIAAISIPVYAVEDGAYTVGRTTSYANPQTGETVDGGTNIALGDSMCASIVEQTALVEQYQGKTYVTLGIGLMSNISNVRIQIQGTDGSYREVGLTQTGSCSRDGDTCNHYRFEVDSADNYISPVLYVTPMGRDVQFFVKLDMGSAAAGTGNFVSEMIPAAAEVTAEETADTGAATQDAAVEVTAEQQTADADSVEATETEEVTEEATEAVTEEATEELVAETEMTEETESVFPEETEEATEQKEETNGKKKSSAPGIIAIIVVVIAAAGGTGYGIYRKKRM